MAVEILVLVTALAILVLGTAAFRNKTKGNSSIIIPRSLQSEQPDNPLNQTLLDACYVVFDTETTGLRPSQGDDLVQLGALRFRDSTQHAVEFDRLVNPGRPIPPPSTLVHGITDAMLRGAATPTQVLQEFSEFTGNSVLVAHCAAFDMTVIRNQRYHSSELFPQPVIDTMLLAYSLDPDHLDLSLDSVAERYNVSITGRHTAMGDARATAEILLAMRDPLMKAGIITVADAVDRCQLLARQRQFNFQF